MIDLFARHAPKMLQPARDAVGRAARDFDFIRLDGDAWGRLPSISIDYAIMERVEGLRVMPVECAWSDLGSCAAVAEQTADTRDAAGNSVSSSALAIDCRGSLLRGEEGRIRLVGIGLEDVVAVATGDAVLVAPKSHSQRVGEAVAALRDMRAPEATEFSRDRRPWGHFESLARGDGFQVKKIVVSPGG